MPLAPPAPQFSLYETNVLTPAQFAGTTLTAPVTPQHTKEATYTELIASTAFDTYFVVITFNNSAAGASNSNNLVDLAIGAAGSEEIIIANLLAGFTTNTVTPGGGRSYLFPLFIPSGSRLAATSQSALVSGTVVMQVELLGGPRMPVWAGSQVITYGITTASSRGVLRTPGSSGAEGAWGEIAAATSQDHEALVLGAQGTNTDTNMTTNGILWDVGIGAAAAEEAIAENLPYMTHSSETTGQQRPWLPIYLPIPSGTRLSVRGSASGTAEAIDCALYGVS